MSNTHLSFICATLVALVNWIITGDFMFAFFVSMPIIFVVGLIWFWLFKYIK